MTSRVKEINQGRIGGSQEIEMLPRGEKVAKGFKGKCNSGGGTH